MHQAADNTYPGLERELQEQREPNSGRLAQPMRTPANSPLAGRQKKPGVGRHSGGSAMQPVSLGLFGGVSTPSKAVGAATIPAPSGSAWTDASAGPSSAALFSPRPADSFNPTVDGPAAKRPRLTQPSTHFGFGLQASGFSAVASGLHSAASCGSDSDGEGEEAVSKKRPTPKKQITPFGLAAAAAAKFAMPPPPPRAAAQHPAPTWASRGLGFSEIHSVNPAASAVTAHQLDQEPSHEQDGMDEDCFGTQMPAAAGTSDGAWSDMEEEEEEVEAALQANWQPFPYPGALDVEE